MKLELRTIAVCAMWVCGCSASHGRGNRNDAGLHADGGERTDAGGRLDAAGPMPDVGVCTIAAAADVRLHCPPDTVLVGDHIDIAVDADNGACCMDGTVSAVATVIDAAHVSIAATMTLCSCSPDLPCATSATTTVSVVATEPGPLTITSGTASCTIDVVAPPPSMCIPAMTTELRAPEAVLQGDTTSLELVANGPRCGCDPELSVTDASVDLELCSCCMICDCPVLLNEYEASSVLGPESLGDHTRSTPLGDWHYGVFASDACTDGPTVDSVEVFVPSATAAHFGPRLTWLKIHYTASYCCATPPVAVLDRFGREGPRSLGLFSCGSVIDCECYAATPHARVVWHSLGELPLGHQSLVVGGHTVEFDVR